jgi:hypothetical protein
MFRASLQGRASSLAEASNTECHPQRHWGSEEAMAYWCSAPSKARIARILVHGLGCSAGTRGHLDPLHRYHDTVEGLTVHVRQNTSTDDMENYAIVFHRCCRLPYQEDGRRREFWNDYRAMRPSSKNRSMAVVCSICVGRRPTHFFWHRKRSCPALCAPCYAPLYRAMGPPTGGLSVPRGGAAFAQAGLPSLGRRH